MVRESCRDGDRAQSEFLEGVRDRIFGDDRDDPRIFLREGIFRCGEAGKIRGVKRSWVREGIHLRSRHECDIWKRRPFQRKKQIKILKNKRGDPKDSWHQSSQNEPVLRNLI